ncbi:MAG: hypothetical protein H8E66_14800 [Planctomycetes bacterium]|nr:hypothetical protein [Planctomycetota bacterium]
MARDTQTVGQCPKCNADNLTCRYNDFEKDDLRIVSWEHKCAECGYRETTAFRSDDPEELQPVDAGTCPYCERSANR